MASTNPGLAGDLINLNLSGSLRKKDPAMIKKDKISYCYTIVGSVCSTATRLEQDFPKVLNFSLETLLTCCDDADADVRMTADECLNRIIRTLLQSNFSRIQVELYKEIKKNGPPRSLRAALWRFASLCHLIRPQKCRPYIANLLPCLIQIGSREEEVVQETLAVATCKIFEVLGKFINENETKVILQAFRANLKSTSAVVRRTAATCLTAVCQNSRKPEHFFVWLLNSLIESVIPVNEDFNQPLVLGALLCCRQILALLSNTQSQSGDPQQQHSNPKNNVGFKLMLSHLIQLYELLLYFLGHSDHNVVTASLECLQQLLRSPPSFFATFLISPIPADGLPLFTSDKASSPRTGYSRLKSLDFGSVSSLHCDDSTLDDEPDSLLGVFNSASSFPIEQGPGKLVEAFELPADDCTSTASIEDYGPEVVTGSGSRLEQFIDEKLDANLGNLDLSEEQADMKSSDDARRSFDSVLDGQETSSMRESSHSPVPDPGAAVAPFQTGDIGHIDDADVTLVYCSRLICSSFLLTGYKGGLIPERHTRVSVKSLALGCVAGVIRLYPGAIMLPLFKDRLEPSAADGDRQYLTDLLLFSRHADPQLRGCTAALVGNFIASGLCVSKGNLELLLPTGVLQPDKLVDIFSTILLDETSVACRLAIVALKGCLNPLLNSVHGPLALPVLSTLLSLPHNAYWLVKVELLELFSELSYLTVDYLESVAVPPDNRHLRCNVDGIQDSVLNKVIEYLADDDYRVRHAAAKAIIRLVPRLYFPKDHIKQDPVVCLSKDRTASLLEPVIHETSIVHSAPSDQVFPYHDWERKRLFQSNVDSSLSRILSTLFTRLSVSSSKYLTLGCMHSLSLLSQEYPMASYSSSWMCCLTDSNIDSATRQSTGPASSSNSKSPEGVDCAEGGLLAMVISLLTSSVSSLNLGLHQDCIQLTSNLFVGAALSCLQKLGAASVVEAGPEEKPWAYLKSGSLAEVANSIFTHLMRVLNICTHIIEDQNPIPPQPKTLSSLPSAPILSPIKRKTKVDAGKPGSLYMAAITRNSPGKGDKDEKGPPKTPPLSNLSSPSVTLPSAVSGSAATGHLGSFNHLPLYIKLYDVLHSTFSSCQMSLDVQGDKFSHFIRCILDAFAQVLEVATVSELGSHAEELLSYLRSMINVEPSKTILCVQQVLKAMFGTNALNHLCGSVQDPVCKPGHVTRVMTNTSPGIYHYCFTSPCANLTHRLNVIENRPPALASENVDQLHWMSCIKRKWERKLPSIGKTSGKGDRTNLASYIRLFESLVIRALKLYTVTSSVDLQCHVLHLLAQLVQLRVNYCLLDSEQIFIGFILKQFEYIEGGQVQLIEKLVPPIFHFLVLLSYERFHSKPIISVPKIIQLCDGIIASGQPPVTHAIPSLLPIVEDLFLVRGTYHKLDAGKELDTQREVLVSMLFRFVQYYQVLEIFILILQQTVKESEERWKKLSRQVVDTLLPLLGRQKVNLDHRVALDVVHRLFETVAPLVFRPVDLLLSTVLAPPHDLSTQRGLQRWLSMVLVILRVLMVQSKEEVLLGRLAELNLSINVFADTLKLHKENGEGLTGNEPFVHSRDGAGAPVKLLSPEELLARFLWQVVGIVATELQNQIFVPTVDGSASQFLCEQLGHLLLFMSHMFQSGFFRRVVNVCMAMVKRDVDANSRFYSISHINATFLDLAVVHPTLTLQWCNVLNLLNFHNQSFWSRVLRPTSSSNSLNFLTSFPFVSGSAADPTFGKASACLNKELVHKGGLILFCDYICENFSDAEHMTWLIVNHINEIVEMCSEPPINDLISNIHRSPAASGLFIQAINTRCENLHKPTVARKVLHCLEAIHMNQTGQLIIFLIRRLLSTPHLTIARATASMACRRMEVLLMERPSEPFLQLSLEDIDLMFDTIHGHNLAKKYSQLVILLLKLRCQWFPKAESLPRTLLPDDDVVNHLSLKTVDKTMFVTFVRRCCQTLQSQRHCVQLLAALEYSSLMDIMGAKEFNLSLLEECLRYGAELFFSEEKDDATQESPLSPFPYTTGGLALLTAARNCLFQHVADILVLAPSPSAVYDPAGLPLTSQEAKYSHQVDDFCGDASLSSSVQLMVPTVAQYLHLLGKHPVLMDLPIHSLNHLCRFSTLALEVLQWSLQNRTVPPVWLQCGLRIISLLLQNPHLVNVLSQPENECWQFTIIYGVHHVFIHLHEPASKVDEKDQHQEDRVGVESGRYHVVRACVRMNEMLSSLEEIKTFKSSMPAFLSDTLSVITIGLSRLHCINGYLRIPPRASALGWTAEGAADMFSYSVPTIPIQLLRNQDVLSQFISRVNLFGWTNRQQFEETWMALLGVLNVPSKEASVSDDEIETVHTTCLAIKCITSLLLQSLLLPQPGNPCNSDCLYQPTEKPVAYLHTRHGKKFPNVWNIVEDRRKNLVGRHAWRDDVSSSWQLPYVTSYKRIPTRKYGPNQVSLEYLQLLISRTDTGFSRCLSSFDERERCLNLSGLDIHSCLHFLLDLYSQWLAPFSNVSKQVAILTEVVRSVIMLCDIFTERYQFQWMWDIFLDLHHCHPQDDEIMTQYLVYGISKVASVLGVGVELQDTVHKILEYSLKSTFLSTRIMALHGVMYLLEVGPTDILQPVLPVLSEYLIQHLKNSASPYGQSEHHAWSMWAVVFYLLENLKEHVPDEFGNSAVQLALDLIMSFDNVSHLIYLRVMYGIERLVLASGIYGKNLQPVIKCAVNRLCEPNSIVSLASFGLLLTCFYAGKDNEMWKAEDLVVSDPAVEPHLAESESLLATMEKVTILFNRMKNGYPCEAETIASVLPYLLTDHFPLSEIMNKVIVEFISNQQPYPHLLAAVVFQVFQWAHQQGQSQLVQEWVLLSLSNFTQQSSISMAVWSLTCFFISASTNPWIRASFPYIQQQLGRLSSQDVHMFCTAGVDFYNQLQNDADRKAFRGIISSKAVTDSAYVNLLEALT